MNEDIFKKNFNWSEATGLPTKDGDGFLHILTKKKKLEVARTHEYQETDSTNSVVCEVSSFVGNPVCAVH